jgi:hypothetical protein
MQHVATSARDAFVAHHRGWGTSVHIADIEMAGLRPNGDRDAEVTVRVAWYRPEDQELRTTVIKQSWRDQGGWKLVDETRLEGAIGLFGEPVIYEAPRESESPTQFPTVRLRGMPQ